MKRYVQVGCGTRGLQSYTAPIVKDFSDCAELCGVYDINPKRAKFASEYAGKEIPIFDDYDKMLSEVKPDIVIVTNKDCDHDTYIIKALRAGCDVISEKPLTTTFEKALAIKKAQEETGRSVSVTFNVRFSPFWSRVKQLVAEGAVGKILSVHFEWMLDTCHGADYFRRWHREFKNSGSLLVHKSTHHFDLVNWLLEEDPLYVNAFGTTRFYGPTREKRSERCYTCPYKRECKFFYDIEKDEFLEKAFLNCEDADGYYRDRCVFSEEIDIQDSMSVNVAYSGGAIMSYSLTAHSPYEGVRLVLNGTDGRMEVISNSITSISYDVPTEHTIKVYNRRGEDITIKCPQTTVTGHGGADEALLNKLIRFPDAPDPLMQMADLRAGLMSIGIGMAATTSMKEGRRVALSEFYDELK